MSSDYLYTPKNYGFIIKKSKKTYIAVFEKYFGRRKGLEYDTQFLKIMPGESLTSNDKEKVEKIIQEFQKYHNEARIISKHKVVHFDNNKEKELGTFYKVIFKENNNYYLVFYSEEKNMINTYKEGYKYLSSY